MSRNYLFLLCVLLMTLFILSACGSSRQETGMTPFRTQVLEANSTDRATPTPGSAIEPLIEIKPESTLADEVVKIQVVGLVPGQTVTLRASLNDDLEQHWESYATFRSDGNGIVDVTTQVPMSGTYHIADPMGLFWSMLPNVPGRDYPIFANFNTNSIPVTVAAEINNEQIATATINRIRLQNDINSVPVSEEGLVGQFYSPKGMGPYAALLILGGSSGNADIRKAALLASHGYATLALDYFGGPGLPRELSEIPLEYFETAIAWLKSQDVADKNRIGVLGTSRGGELALLLGATFPELKAVVGYVPSGTVWGNLTSTSIGERAAWTYQGKPVPFATVRDPGSINAAIIPVEKINGPILLLSGKDDQVWPSAYLSEIAVARLKEYNHPYSYEHLSYEDAGHLIGLPYWPTTMNQVTHPVTGAKLVFGGTARGNAFASTDAWARVLEFLENNLRNSTR